MKLARMFSFIMVLTAAALPLAVSLHAGEDIPPVCFKAINQDLDLNLGDIPRLASSNPIGPAISQDYLKLEEFRSRYFDGLSPALKEKCFPYADRARDDLEKFLHRRLQHLLRSNLPALALAEYRTLAVPRLFPLQLQRLTQEFKQLENDILREWAKQVQDELVLAGVPWAIRSLPVPENRDSDPEFWAELGRGKSPGAIHYPSGRIMLNIFSLDVPTLRGFLIHEWSHWNRKEQDLSPFEDEKEAWIETLQILEHAPELPFVFKRIRNRIQVIGLDAWIQNVNPGPSIE